MIKLLSVLFLFSNLLFASTSILIESVDLKPIVNNTVVLDTRSRVEFEKEHISGARWIDREVMVKHSNDRNTKAVAEYLKSLGLQLNSKVVTYDGGEMENSAQVAWMLEYIGLKDISMLNGGIFSWKEENKFSVDNKAEKNVRSSGISPKWNNTIFASMNDVRQNLKTVTLIDTRSDAEYKGKEVRAKRGGTIPGAKNRNFNLFLDANKRRFRSKEEITKIFAQVGIDPLKPAMVFCQTGRRSSVVYFALKLLGNKDVKNYFASWSEWGNNLDVPIQ